MYAITFQRIHPAAVLPRYAHPEDAGMDLTAVETVTIAPGESALVKTGLLMELPENTEAQIRPRSGLALKHAVTVLNSPGTIDQGYRGELGVILINHGRDTFTVEPGMRIAQMVIAPVVHGEVTEGTVSTESLRGSGGFGSTGK